MLKVASSPNSGLTLPPELLWEMTKYMGFDGLRQCCQTNFQLNALTHPAAMKMKQKLEDYYLGDIRLLATWFQCWMTKSQEIRTELLQQCYRVEEAKKSTRTQKNRKNRGYQQLLITMALLMEKFCQNLDQLSNKMATVIRAEPKPSSGRPPLSPDCLLRFAKRRCNVVKKTFLAPKAQLQYWLNVELCEWAKIFASVGPFRDFYHQDLTICHQGMYRCKQRIQDCQKLMMRCVDALLFPRCI